MGLRSSNLTAALAYNPHPVFARQHPVSLHNHHPQRGAADHLPAPGSLQPQLEPQVLLLDTCLNRNLHACAGSRH